MATLQRKVMQLPTNQIRLLKKALLHIILQVNNY